MCRIIQLSKQIFYSCDLFSSQIFKLQSTDAAEVGSSSEELSTVSDSTQSTVKYMDAIPESTISYSPIADNSFYSSYTPGVELGDFFSRPVLIQSYTWTEGSTFDQSFYPWRDYFDDTRIKKKLDNYSFVSCNLHVKVLMNASPFYYGLAIMAWQPLASFTPTTIVNVDSYSDDLIPLSQQPHIYLYPQTSQAGEMELPFFHMQDWIEATVEQKFIDMGTMRIRSVVPLANANSVSSGTVNVQVYAWASNVKLAGPTVGLALQARDEYTTKGIISTPASAIASAASKLSKVPVIGPYATATAMIASAIGSVASLFGYTNPPVMDNGVPTRPSAFRALASTQVSEPIEKLTLDPKNELTIDPRVVGLPPDDEMLISNIVQRESFLTKFTWTSARIPGDLLFGIRVLPDLCAVTGVYRQSTPLCYFNNMFDNWRGDIIFRFRFICSKFHRGRARITWDPSSDIITDAVSSSVAFTQIVDISDNSDIEIRVPYVQALPWLLTTREMTTERYNNGGYSYVRDAGRDNGTLTVRVFNSQTSPVLSADVSVAVSVRGAENFEFANPIDPPDVLSIANFTLQSLDYEKPVLTVAGQTAGSSDPNRYLVNFGESIVSLRSVLRRSTYSRTFVGSTNTAALNATTVFRMGRFPLYYGYDLNGIDRAVGILVPGTSNNFNYVQVTPFNWVAPCYIGMRGSMNLHVNVDSGAPISNLMIKRALISRTRANMQGDTFTNSTGDARQLTSRNWRAETRPGSSGIALTNQRTQAGLSVQLPDYNNYRMRTTDPTTNCLGTGRDVSNVDTFNLISTYKSTASTDASLGVLHHLHYGIGTDFTFLFFLNTPTMLTCVLPGVGTGT